MGYRRHDASMGGNTFAVSSCLTVHYSRRDKQASGAHRKFLCRGWMFGCFLLHRSRSGSYWRYCNHNIEQFLTGIFGCIHCMANVQIKNLFYDGWQKYLGVGGLSTVAAGAALLMATQLGPDSFIQTYDTAGWGSTASTLGLFLIVA